MASTSTKWLGWWEQAAYGRQAMTELALQFAEGQIRGEGGDIVGLFVFAGEYHPDGTVVLVKRYLGQHEVLYVGRFDGEGSIIGEWLIGEYFRGRFALWPDRQPADPDNIPTLA